MEIKQVKQQIDKWATENFKEFERGVFSIDIDSRRESLLVLFASLKSEGAEKDTVKAILGNMLRLCVPLKKIDKKKQWGWANHSANDILSTFMEVFGDCDIDVKGLIEKTFPDLSRKGDPAAKKRFIDGALSQDIAVEPNRINSKTDKEDDTIDIDSMFKLESKPIDLSLFRKKEKPKMIRFDPEMDNILGLSEDKDV